MDDGYFGRPKKPPFRASQFLEAYLTGYQIGHDQRQLEIEDGTHCSLQHGYKFCRYRPRRSA